MHVFVPVGGSLMRVPHSPLQGLLVPVGNALMLVLHAPLNGLLVPVVAIDGATHSRRLGCAASPPCAGRLACVVVDDVVHPSARRCRGTIYVLHVFPKLVVFLLALPSNVFIF
jgi:hypothetical protein